MILGGKPPPVTREHYGDIRDTLKALPENPWGGYGGSYVLSDLFPVRHEIVRERCPDARSIFEFGGYFGYCLVTLLDAAQDATRVGWTDAELYTEGSNARCGVNLDHYLDGASRDADVWSAEHPIEALEFGQADIVAVDGDHTLAGCLVDLTLALALRPKLILVDDFTAIQEVADATAQFAFYTGLNRCMEVFETTNGLALFDLRK